MGKSTAVNLVSELLIKNNYSVDFHIEGDPLSPLDLCWIAYLTRDEYDEVLQRYSVYANDIADNIVWNGDYILLRYQNERTPLYPSALYEELHSKEFCYNPNNATVLLKKYTDVFLDLWGNYSRSNATDNDFGVFDASLVSHMTNDLKRNYNASPQEISRHLQSLLQSVRELNPIIFYLYSNDVRSRLIDARQNRKQTPPTIEQIKFWEERKRLDLSVLPMLSVKSIMLDVSDNRWGHVISTMLDKILL